MVGDPKGDAIKRAMAAQQMGDDTAEENACREALEINPKHPVMRHNLSALLARRGETVVALEFLDALVEDEPGYTSAHFNRGGVLISLGRTEDAIKAFLNVTSLDPNHIDAHRALGFQWLALGNRDRSLDHFARTYDLRRGEGRIGVAEKSLHSTSSEKLQHDADLFRCLLLSTRAGQRFETLARLYEQVAAGLRVGVVELSEEQLETLGSDYNTSIYSVDAPEIFGGALNPDIDATAIEASWKASETGVVTIDNLLTERGLALLQKFLQQSTIWHDFTHIGGFVATYLEDGMACPLVLQIADEFRAALPGLLGPHPLTQAWAFKALGSGRSIDIHADDAAISLNFWVTPDDANRNPDKGGLVVYCYPPPSDWSIVDYDSDRARIRTFLAENGSSAITVPYRENRGVLFESRLFHGTDRPDFSSGYANHRINVTMLFGNRG
ncbi:MAG: tetratricopeptide repeat protein [Pseudomonadota bacterium]|nr:tetratricopeptide repeat protein [Pseudomonadota bacterium]